MFVEKSIEIVEGMDLNFFSKLGLKEDSIGQLDYGSILPFTVNLLSR